MFSCFWNRDVPDTKKSRIAGYRISGRIFKVLTFFCQFYNYQFIYLSCYSHFFHFPQLISQYFNRNLSIELNIQYIRYIRLLVSGQPDIRPAGYPVHPYQKLHSHGQILHFLIIDFQLLLVFFSTAA